MTVLDQINSELKQNQGNGKKAFLLECKKRLFEASLVNENNYTSRRKPSITYSDPGTASLSRLIEYKNISNNSLDNDLSFSKDHICRIRQGKHIPTDLELARICIALELYESTIRLLFKAFGKDYDVNQHRLNCYLCEALYSPLAKDKTARLKLFDSMTT